MDLDALTPQIDKALNVLVLLLVVVLAHQAGKITLELMQDLPMGTGTITKGKAASANESSLDINSLLALHVFGEAGKIEELVPVQESIEAPETKLSLVLQGVSVGKTEESSSAIISESKGASGEIYWLGDSVSGQAILSAVYDDRVVIKQNGRLETLSFDDEFKGITRDDASPVYSSNNQAEPTHSDMLRSYRSRRQDKDDLMKDINRSLNDVYRGDFESFDSLMDEYGSNMEKNIDAAIRTAGLEVTSEGMKLGSRTQENWMNQVGLKRGDIVKSVNGYSTLTLKSDRSALDSVIKSCLARIEVQRGANTFVVTYPFCN